MDLSVYDQSSARLSPPPPLSIKLHGPKPTPLKLGKESHKIKKPSLRVPPPVIIYAVSPKVIHASPSEFMGLVQRLTGLDSGTNSTLPPPDPSAGSSRQNTEVPLQRTGGRGNGDRFSGPKMSSLGPVGLIRPVPQKLLPPKSDQNPFINLNHHQHTYINEDLFNNEDLFSCIDYDQVVEYKDDVGGGSCDSAFFSGSCPMLSPASLKLLSELLYQ